MLWVSHEVTKLLAQIFPKKKPWVQWNWIRTSTSAVISLVFGCREAEILDLTFCFVDAKQTKWNKV